MSHRQEVMDGRNDEALIIDMRLPGSTRSILEFETAFGRFILYGGMRERMDAWRTQIGDLSLESKRFLVICGRSGCGQLALALQMCETRPRLEIYDYHNPFPALRAVAPGCGATVVFVQPPVDFMLSHKSLFTAVDCSPEDHGVNLFGCDIIVTSESWFADMSTVDDDSGRWVYDNRFLVVIESQRAQM